MSMTIMSRPLILDVSSLDERAPDGPASDVPTIENSPAGPLADPSTPTPVVATKPTFLVLPCEIRQKILSLTHTFEPKSLENANRLATDHNYEITRKRKLARKIMTRRRVYPILSQDIDFVAKGWKEEFRRQFAEAKEEWKKEGWRKRWRLQIE